MKHVIFGAFASALFLAGCAVSANDFEAGPLPQFERAATTINERIDVRVTDPSVLSVQATVLGNTCSAVGVSGDFQDRFNEVFAQAFAGVFVGDASAGATVVTVNVVPETPRVRLLRRSYMSGDARVDLALAADVTITRADGAQQQFRVSADDTRAQADEPTSSCDGAARGLARAFDDSAAKLATQVRQAIIAAPPSAAP